MRTDFTLRHWLAALGVALAVHALASLGFGSPKPVATDTDSGGIYLNLGNSGRPETDPGTGEPPLPALRDAAAAKQHPQPQEISDAAKVEPEAEEASRAEPKRRALDEKADFTDQPTRQATQPQRPEAEPRRRIRESNPEAAAAAAAPSPRESARPGSHRATTGRGGQVARTSRAAGTGAGGATSRAAGGRKVSGNDNTSAGFGSGDGSANYLTALRAWLEAHKRYPPQARARNQAGDVTVSFVLHADGRLTDASVAESSGFSILDHAALELFKRASPGPKPPTERQLPMRLSVPVLYRSQ